MIHKNKNMIGNCPSTFAYKQEREVKYKIYPNPATTELNILAENSIKMLVKK